jgi:hypothetical protein
MLSKLKPGMKSSINTRRKAMRIIGLIIVLVFVLVLTGGHTAGVFHPLGIVIVFSLGALLFGGTSFPTMFKAVFSSKATDEELSAGIAAWARARTYTMAAGWIGLLWGILRTVGGMYILARQTAETGMTAPPILAAGIAEDLISTMVGLRFMFCAVILAYGIYLPLQARLEDRIG